MSALTTLTGKLAKRLEMEGDGGELIATLKATAFKGQVSDAQMIALLIVANQYGLNPWTKEIYAFPDKNNGIVPVVGVDGWSRIINGHEQFDGLEFNQDDESCTCIIHRKDRGHPISVTEYMSECKRGAGPWLSHPKRMLRHKALIQCARLAFGYTGIFDEDEAQRITERDMGTINRDTGEVTQAPKQELPPCPQEDLEAQFPKWRDAIAAGKKTPQTLLAFTVTRYTLTDEQKAQILALKATNAAIDTEFTKQYEDAEQ